MMPQTRHVQEFVLVHHFVAGTVSSDLGQLLEFSGTIADR